MKPEICMVCGKPITKTKVPRNLGDGRVWRWKTEHGFYCGGASSGWHTPAYKPQP